MRCLVAWIALALALGASAAKADEPTSTPSAERGYELLLNKAYLPPDFDQEAFDSVWKTWPEPLRTQAEQATPAERRKLAYERYGLTARPNDPLQRPLQYVVDEQGTWTMNCFACHQGHLDGQVIPGLPNSHYALETLTNDMRQIKLLLRKKLSNIETGSVAFPLGTSNGTTNAVMFGVTLMNYRDADLNLVKDRPAPKLTHHDHDAPPWWNVSQKKRLYADSFAPKSHRALMQFLLVPDNGPEKFREWEEDYRHIAAYIDSLAPPKYPHPIEADRAARGEKVFLQSCADCHGTYGAEGTYPERIIPIDEVGTDPVRLASLDEPMRTAYDQSWFNDYGQKAKSVVKPGGYVAPPLSGVWASAPYFHNGSVPTLWHVLHPEQRPVVWRRTAQGYDWERVGLEISEFGELPEVEGSDQRRTYFDTAERGKSAAGHDFPSALSEEERRDLLEYLKTL